MRATLLLTLLIVTGAWGFWLQASLMEDYGGLGPLQSSSPPAKSSPSALLESEPLRQPSEQAGARIGSGARAEPAAVLAEKTLGDFLSEFWGADWERVRAICEFRRVQGKR